MTTRILETQRIRESALHYVNIARKALGMPELADLAMGTPNSMRQCSISQSLNGICYTDYGNKNGFVHFKDGMAAAIVADAWGTTYKVKNDDNFEVITPEDIRRFVELYDTEAYPDLVSDMDTGKEGEEYELQPLEAPNREETPTETPVENPDRELTPA